jgi:hypothetical protein
MLSLTLFGLSEHHFKSCPARAMKGSRRSCLSFTLEGSPRAFSMFSMNHDLPHQNLTVDHFILGLGPIRDLSGLFCGCSRLEVTRKITRTSWLIPLCARDLRCAQGTIARFEQRKPHRKPALILNRFRWGYRSLLSPSRSSWHQFQLKRRSTTFVRAPISL